MQLVEEGLILLVNHLQALQEVDVHQQQILLEDLQRPRKVLQIQLLEQEEVHLQEVVMLKVLIAEIQQDVAQVIHLQEEHQQPQVEVVVAHQVGVLLLEVARKVLHLVGETKNLILTI